MQYLPGQMPQPAGPPIMDMATGWNISLPLGFQIPKPETMLTQAQYDHINALRKAHKIVIDNDMLPATFTRA